MGRGQRPIDEQLTADAQLRRGARLLPEPDERAEVVCVELWLNRNVVNATQVDVRVRASGYGDFSLRSDFPIEEAESEALAEDFSLELLRALLTRELADAVAQELDVVYRYPSVLSQADDR